MGEKQTLTSFAVKGGLNISARGPTWKRTKRGKRKRRGGEGGGGGGTGYFGVEVGVPVSGASRDLRPFKLGFVYSGIIILLLGVEKIYRGERRGSADRASLHRFSSRFY